METPFDASNESLSCRARQRALVPALFLVLSSACSGAITGDTGAAGGSGTPGSTPGTPPRGSTPGTTTGGTGAAPTPGGTGGTGVTGPVVGPGAPPPTAPPATPGVVIPPGTVVDAPACGAAAPVLRRLTRDEYDNTIRDLLGDASRPGQGFPADVSSHHSFENDVKSLNVSPLLVEKYEDTSAMLIDNLYRVEAAMPVGSRKVLICDPSGDGKACATQVLQRFLPRAWRRPAAAAEVERLVKFLDVAKTQGDGYEQGIKLALQAALMSPSFLFRLEEAAPGQALDEYALASKLSYFLWSSMPDEALFAQAAGKKLRDPAVLRAEAKRMLADPRAAALVESFAAQWLDLRLVEGVSPDAKLFPTVTSSVKRAMRLETEHFFRAFLMEDRSALDMMDAPFTYLTDELAQHYKTGWPNSKEPKLMKLEPWMKRGGGLLSHGSILSVTSMPDRTSVVNRGAWVMTKLLCQPPPPPPPDVPPLPMATATAKTQRQRTIQHSANPACAGCHKLLDPIGFGLENFDAVGVWRDQDGGMAVDATGSYRDQPFKGHMELSAKIKADPALAACMVEKVYTYALGRQRATQDEAALAGLTKAFADKQHRLSGLLIELAASPSFTTRCAQ